MLVDLSRDYNNLMAQPLEKAKNNMYAKEMMNAFSSWSIKDIEAFITELNRYLEREKSNIFFTYNIYDSTVEIKTHTQAAVEVVRYISIRELIPLSYHYKKFRGIVLDYCS